MSRTNIPEKVKIRLWGKAAGRCQYEGCNEPLWLDTLTKSEFNTAYIAHIIADSPKGPRGDEKLSNKLKHDIANLMLLCDEHHRLIDEGDKAGHPVERLIDMKQKHERRVEIVTSIKENMGSNVLLYGANIGRHTSPINIKNAIPAMLPGRYPAEIPAVEIHLKNSSFQDNQELYWAIESDNLKSQFQDKIRRRIELGDIDHISVFGLAPQPLLILLGTLISDIVPTDVYQLHREPTTWKWQSVIEENSCILKEPEVINKNIALNLSLSADINNNRITKVLGEDTSIWTVTLLNPDNDYLKSREQLSGLRKRFRTLLNRIKSIHGQDKTIHVFPAMPVSAAIELGRVWMPKADLPLAIYDENRVNGGFSHAINIGE